MNTKGNKRNIAVFAMGFFEFLHGATRIPNSISVLESGTFIILSIRFMSTILLRFLFFSINWVHIHHLFTSRISVYWNVEHLFIRVKNKCAFVTKKSDNKLANREKTLHYINRYIDIDLQCWICFTNFIRLRHVHICIICHRTNMPTKQDYLLLH